MYILGINAYQAVKDVSASFDALVELLECIGTFLIGLIYTKIRLQQHDRSGGEDNGGTDLHPRLGQQVNRTASECISVDASLIN